MADYFVRPPVIVDATTAGGYYPRTISVDSPTRIIASSGAGDSGRIIIVNSGNTRKVAA